MPQERAKASLVDGGARALTLDVLGLVPRILVGTDGTLTHILEAYAAEQMCLVKLAQTAVTDPAVRADLGLGPSERALRRVILLRGATSGTTFIFADSAVMLDRLPASVATGLMDTEVPIGKLLFSCRAETLREIIAMSEERDPDVAPHFGLDGREPLVSRTYQIVLEGRPIARITEKFPKEWARR